MRLEQIFEFLIGLFVFAVLVGAFTPALYNLSTDSGNLFVFGSILMLLAFVASFVKGR